MSENKQPLVAPDYWRQLDVFPPDKFHEEVHIIGVGAVGSWVAYILAKMGVRKIHAWDFDYVEAHNLPNQIFGQGDVGEKKVEALKKRLDYDCRCEIVSHFCAVGDPCSEKGKEFSKKHPEIEQVTPKLSGIVFLCPDKMSVRQFCWESAIKYQLDVKLMVEVRMAAELFMVHTVNPMRPQEVDGFERTLSYSDEESEESSCTNRAIATTVAEASGVASHKLVKWQAGELIKPIVKIEDGDSHSNYDLHCIRPIIVTTAQWS